MVLNKVVKGTRRSRYRAALQGVVVECFKIVACCHYSGLCCCLPHRYTSEGTVNLLYSELMEV